MIRPSPVLTHTRRRHPALAIPHALLDLFSEVLLRVYFHICSNIPSSPRLQPSRALSSHTRLCDQSSRLPFACPSALNTLTSQIIIKPVLLLCSALFQRLEAKFRPHQRWKRSPQNIRFLCISSRHPARHPHTLSRTHASLRPSGEFLIRTIFNIFYYYSHLNPLPTVV